MFSPAEKHTLLQVARHAIQTALGQTELHLPDNPSLKTPCGVFVTLTRNNDLRGCIGNPHATLPLIEQVVHSAQGAALRDPRFPPVTTEELHTIEIEISVLTPMQKLQNPDTLEIGRHGLYVKQDLWSGLLLPKVAKRFGWNSEMFLNQVCHKAGLSETAWREDKTQVWTFEADVFAEQPEPPT